jgi:hypothetical protein
VLRYDLQKMIGESSATIGVSRFGPGQKADFFLVGFTGPVGPAWLTRLPGRLRRKERLDTKTAIMFAQGFGRELQLMRFPQATSYPFPTILFFRARAET